MTIKINEDKDPIKARVKQREFVAKLLREWNKNAALVIFYNENSKNWRISFIRLNYEFTSKGIEEKITPAKRLSYVVGEGEASKTVREQFLTLANMEESVSLEQLEELFALEKVTNEFFKEYIIIPRLKKNGYSITNKNVTVKATEQGGSFSAPKRDEEGFNIYGAWDWEKEKSKAGVYLGSADKIESNYTSESATIKAGKNITLIAKNDVENLESNILTNGNVDITANRLINKNFEVAIKRKITLIRDIE